MGLGETKIQVYHRMGVGLKPTSAGEPQGRAAQSIGPSTNSAQPLSTLQQLC